MVTSSSAESVSNVGVYFTNYFSILAISKNGGCCLYAHYTVIGTKSDCATPRTRKPVILVLCKTTISARSITWSVSEPKTKQKWKNIDNCAIKCLANSLTGREKWCGKDHNCLIKDENSGVWSRTGYKCISVSYKWYLNHESNGKILNWWSWIVGHWFKNRI